MMPPYIHETDELLRDGGIAKKTVKQITEKSKQIKDCIDLRIYGLIESLEIKPSFMVLSPVLQ